MEEIIGEVTAYMREHTDRELSVAELAARFGYSKFHFSREFRKLIGVSPNAYWAALKMEQSLASLPRSSSVLGGHLSVGYQSTGTFSSSFLKTTGMTPGEYKDEIRQQSLFRIAKEYEERDATIMTHYSFDKKDPSTRQQHVLSVTCHMPEDFRGGIIFVGMFTRPLPNVAPMLGKALVRTNQVIIDQIPNGEYYPMACAIRSSPNPLHYFFLGNALRDLHRIPVHFPLEADTEISFTLREPVPTDPAIPMNPVKLLVDALIRRTS